jgi:hypothetical protein
MPYSPSMNTNHVPKYFTASEWKERIQVRPSKILASNSKLRKDGIHNISFPAFRASVVVNGELEEFKTCPNAGACAAFCYARSGAYTFSNVRLKHTQNLQFLLDDPFSFADQLVKEIQTKVKHTPGFRAIRINDSGDLNTALWTVMKQVMIRLPNVKFYAYTKQISFMKAETAKGNIPANFTYVCSFGGLEDNLIDKEVDRHSVIFPNRKALRAAKYTEAYHSDIPASNPNTRKVGLVLHGNHLAIHKLKERTNVVLVKSVKLGAA